MYATSYDWIIFSSVQTANYAAGGSPNNRPLLLPIFFSILEQQKHKVGCDRIQILPPFSKKFQKVPKLSKSKQTNKRNQFKIPDDRAKRETICNVVFLKKKYNYVMDCDKTHLLST